MRAAFVLAVAACVCALADDYQIGGGIIPGVTTRPPFKIPTKATLPQGGWPTYTPFTYPNSLIDYQACNMMGLSLVCDPNNVLDDGNGNITANREQIEDVVDRIRRTTTCACAATDSNFGECKGEGGFTVSVALVQNMRLDEDDDADDKVVRVRAAARFADDLRKIQDRGQCSDDVLVFLSRGDRVMFTATGEVAARYLTTELINGITVNAETYFVRGDYTKGLNYTLSMYEHILKGEKVDLSAPEGWYWPIPLWAVILIGVVLLLIALTLLGLSIYCCVKCCCQSDRKAEYRMAPRA